jgi:hypothetical protein
MRRWADEVEYPIEAIDSHLSREMGRIRNHRKDQWAMGEELESPTYGRDEPVFGRDLTRSVDERGMGTQLTVAPRRSAC